MFKAVESSMNFPEMENKWLQEWQKTGLLKKYLIKNDTSDARFSFLDGPITANGYMGVHHAWGRSYKDLFQKFFNLLGYRQRFQNGFDCQGLWVEVEVEKELKLHSKKDIENLVQGDKRASVAKFVELCKERVYKFSDIQTNQSQRLGYFMDWDHSYFTMSPENNYAIWHFLKICYENGWVYKGHESVPWCPRCQTAISQHEMLTEDYKEVVHDSLFIEVPIVDRLGEYLIFWTTTPWTIPANIAIAVDEKIEYALVEGATGNKYWVANDLVDSVFSKGKKKVIKTALGKELVGLHYEGPFDLLPAVSKVKKANKNFHTVIPTDPLIMPISTTEGTGLVHTAVSAGTEDFALGKKLGLPMIHVIEDDASYMVGFGEFTGKNAKKHPELIIDYLKSYKNGEYLFEVMPYKHRYPACWRCKAELVWKIADEWYIAMDRVSGKSDERTLRERMIAVANKIAWMPAFGLDRELDWLKNMHDWLISKKNRYWGLALPIYECKKCHTFEVIGSIAELQQRAVSGWDLFEGHTPHKPYIDEVVICCKTCNQEVRRIEDVGNPWLDAGIVPFSTIKNQNEGEPLYSKDRKEWEKWFPIDFITESFPGQFKNWFYSLIAMSTVQEDENPFKRVLGYATVMGEDGRAMHKSWGNYIEFNEAADKIGVDVMRWMFARQNPADNLLFGYKKADEVRRLFYLMLWNSYKYLVDYANLEHEVFDKAEYKNTALKSGNVLDVWIRARFHDLAKNVKENLQKFETQVPALSVESFVNDLSTWYIRRSRDRVWVNSQDTQDKKYFYATMYAILRDLAVMLSPFMPFVSEEIYHNLTGGESVHLASWPTTDWYGADDLLISEMARVRILVEAGHRARLASKLKVKQPLSRAVITAPSIYKLTHPTYSAHYIELIKSELNVKEVEFVYEDSAQVVTVVFDTKLTPHLVLEGELREALRQIQQMRKEQGVQVDEKISLTIPHKFEVFKEHVQHKVLAADISFGDVIGIKRVK